MAAPALRRNVAVPGELRPVTPGGIKPAQELKFLRNGAVMRVSLGSFHHLLRVFLASAIGFVLILRISVTLAAPLPVQAATNATTHQSITTNPQCMRRVTITSKPCGAMIYIDGTQVGRTPMSFPMPTGRYTLVLLAPGHQPYGQRFLVPDAPLEIDANLIPEP